jgi:hypothetical protein
MSVSPFCPRNSLDAVERIDGCARVLSIPSGPWAGFLGLHCSGKQAIMRKLGLHFLIRGSFLKQENGEI